MIRALSFRFFLWTLILVSGTLTSSVQATGSSDLSVEYEQVRKIAMRDARVKEGFDRANERLTEKIVELDPALKTYASSHAQNSPSPLPTTVVHRPLAAAPPAPSHPAKPLATHPVTTRAQRTHVVATGETIVGIAHRYSVSAASIETANHITDPRKLRAGQSLVIPGAGAPAATDPPKALPPPQAPPVAAPSPSAPAAEPQQDGIWDKLKHSF